MNISVDNLKHVKGNAGFSYAEIIIAIFLISIALIPAIESIQSAQIGSGVNATLATQHYHLAAKVEEVLAQPFSALLSAATTAGSETVATSYSDVSGSINRRLSCICHYMTETTQMLTMTHILELIMT